MRYFFSLLLCCLASIGAVAQSTYYVRGVARCILDDGSGTYPVAEAGEVFVGLSADEAPQWTAGENATAVVSGAVGGSSVKVPFYYWARAKAGYTFIGWASTKTSKTASAGTADLEGQPWAQTKSISTVSSLGSAEKPLENARYAIFRKNTGAGDIDLPGNAVPLTAVSNNEHVMGSTLTDWKVKLEFAEPLAYRNFIGYSEGYGVNAGLLYEAICKSETGADVRIVDAKVGGSPTLSGEDAYGVITFPASLPVGAYSVHLPEGLFLTAGGNHSAACDFEVKVVPDETPFLITDISPEEGQKWNASTDPDDSSSDGESIPVRITFNKLIASLATGTPRITLVNSLNGCVRRYLRFSVSKLNPKQGIIDFGKLPNGSYTFTLPQGVFFDQNGQGNAKHVLHFSVKNSDAAEWLLPTYTDVAASVANNSVVNSIESITFTMSRPGFSAPCSFMKGAKITATQVTEMYAEGVDYSDPDNRPEMVAEDISGVTMDIIAGRLVILFDTPFEEEAKVLINIPEGTVINKDNASSMTAEALYRADGCTNPVLSLTLIVKPDHSVITGAAPLPAATGSTGVFTIDGRRTTATARSGVSIEVSADGTVRKIIR